MNVTWKWIIICKSNRIRIFDTTTICNRIINDRHLYYYIIVEYNSILELPHYILYILMIAIIIIYVFWNMSFFS